MPPLTITKTYLNGNILTQQQLDAAFNSISTLLNTTLLDSTNVQVGGLLGTNLASGTVGTTQITSGAITTSLIASSAITTAVIAPLSVTRPQQAPLGAQLSASCGLFSVTSGTVDVTNLSVSVTTSGRLVRLELVSDGTGNNSGYSISSSGCSILFYQNTSEICRFGVPQGGGSFFGPVPGGLSHVDTTIASSAYTYKVVASTTVANTIKLNYLKLIAYEL